jgi:hypothetical protein
VFAPMFRWEGVERRSLSAGGWVEPSIDDTRTKNGICRDEEVQKEYIKLSILGHAQRVNRSGDLLVIYVMSTL